MQQPKNEPNANPIRTLKKSRVISTGKLSKIRLNRRPQRGFTGDHRDHKGRIQKAKTGDCRAAAIRNQSCIAVGQGQRLTSREKTRRDRLVAATNFPQGSQILLSRNLFRTGHSIIHPNKLFSVTSVTSCSSSFSANFCSIVPGWRPDGRTRLLLIHS